MGRPGSALDNAVIESWHSTLEFELRSLHAFTARAQARAAVAAWTGDDNHVRRHSALGMRSRVEYEWSLAGRDAA
jgi:putative transposase